MTNVTIERDEMHESERKKAEKLADPQEDDHA